MLRVCLFDYLSFIILHNSEADYVCESNGEPPIDTVVAGEGEPIATEGEVCCGGAGGMSSSSNSTTDAPATTDTSTTTTDAPATTDTTTDTKDTTTTTSDATTSSRTTLFESILVLSFIYYYSL